MMTFSGQLEDGGHRSNEAIVTILFGRDMKFRGIIQRHAINFTSVRRGNLADLASVRGT